MKYLRDIDYFIYGEDFPHRGVVGVIVANTDGTANIYINTLYSPERQAKALRHELRHLIKDHLWTDTKTIVEKELEADEDDPSIIFGPNFEYVEYRTEPETDDDTLTAALASIEFTHSLPYTIDTMPTATKRTLLEAVRYMQATAKAVNE